MLRIIRTSDDTVISIREAIDVDTDGYSSVDDMLVRLMEEQAAGRIKIEPSGEALQRLAVRATIETFTAKDRASDGIRSFVPDRRGGRINRTAARIAELDQVCKREAILSIQRFLNIEGPSAYRSQAELLGLLDPTVDIELVARQASSAVGDAVRVGLEKGKAAAAPDSATG